MKIGALSLLMLISINLFACNGNHKELVEPDIPNSGSMNLRIIVGQSEFTATLYDNATATAFKTKLPMTIHMVELNGNEKYYDLPDNLPTNASNPGTIQSGDLMLYGSNTLVLFYKTFSTSYNYTRIGKITDPEGLAEALGSGKVDVTFELK
ncbi:cyclophilin-like fold protein [Pontibacter saemangeumensis]